MANRYTAITKKRGDWWIGWIEEVPGVNCQERTEAELLDSLRTALQEAIQFNRDDAIKAAAPDFTEVELVVSRHEVQLLGYPLGEAGQQVGGAVDVVE